jgi:hypothetical protein
MKKSLAVLLFFTYALMADDAQKIQKLEQQVQELQKSLLELKENYKENKKITRESIDETYSYVEEVETRTLEDKLKFGLWLKFGNDNIDKTYANGEEVKSNNLLSTKLMFNVKADMLESLKFYGRVSMYKYWGSSATHPYSYYDNMQGRVPSDSSLYVERAYIDWFFFQGSALPMALTIGRQPTGDGPSHQFKDNVSRKATYSAILYDGVADGAVVTMNLAPSLGLQKTYLRLGYSKGFGYVNSDAVPGNAYIGASNSDIKDTNVYGVFLDTTFFGVENSLVQFSYSKMKDIIANPLDINYSNNKNLGDMDLAGAMVEFTNLNNLNLDLFAHYGYNKTHPNGEKYIIPYEGKEYYVSLLSTTFDPNAPFESHSGYAYWLGGRYGFGKNEKYKIGLEYNHGSQYWVSLTQGSFDVYNKLATRGDVYEAYVMYVANHYLNFRLGYMDINYDYSRSGWFVGESVAVDSIPKDAAGAKNIVSKLNSIYIQMNVVY